MTQQSPESRVAGALGLLAILVTAALLRLHDLDHSLWEDELLTRLRAERSYREIWDLYAQALYLSTVRYATALGSSEAVLRLPSVLFGILGVAAIYQVGRSAGGRGTGMTAAFLLALSAYHLQYSQEARYYSLLMLTMLLALWLMHRAISAGRILDWAGLLIVAWIGARTHLFALVGLGGMAIGASLWLLLARMEGGWRRRITRIALLAACLLAADAGLHAPAVLGALGVLESSPMQYGMDEYPPPAGEAEVHQLTPTNYVQFYNAYFPYSAGVQLALLGFALIGLGHLLWRKPSLGVPLLTVTILAPVPFFFVTVGHFFHDRYFSFQAVFAVLLIAHGVFVTSHAAAALAAARLPAQARLFGGWGGVIFAGISRREAITGLLVAVLLLAFMPWAALSLRAQYESRPVRDYRGLVEYIAPTLHPGDAIYLLGPQEGSNFIWFPLRLTLAMSLPDAPNQLSWLDRRRGWGTPSEAEIAAFVSRFPENSVRFVGSHQYWDTVGTRLEQMGADREDFGRVSVWTFGRPTRNLIRFGNFEDMPPEHLEQPGFVVTGPDEAWSGANALRIERAEPGESGIAFDLQAISYRLRNAEFAVWEDNGPTGWEVSRGGGRIRRVEGPNGGPALGMAPSSSPIVVRQGVPMGTAPGKRITVEAQGLAHEPRTLALFLEFEVDGDRVREEAFHSGDAGWEPITLTALVPGEAAAESLTVGIRRLPDGQDTAAMTSIQVQPPGGPPALDHLQVYTVSLMLKYRDVQTALPFRSADPPAAGQVAILTHDPDSGQNEVHHVYRFGGSSPWRPLSFTLRPGDNIPLRSQYTKVLVKMHDATGTIWLDNVQVEAGERQSPFTPDSRPPHDERFAQ